MVKKPSSAGNSHRLSKSFTCARGDTASLFSDFDDDDDDDDEDDEEEEERGRMMILSCKFMTATIYKDVMTMLMIWSEGCAADMIY